MSTCIRSRFPWERKRALARRREFNIRREMRKILGYRKKLYIPRDEADWESLCTSFFDLGSLVLNGT